MSKRLYVFIIVTFLRLQRFKNFLQRFYYKNVNTRL